MSAAQYEHENMDPFFRDLGELKTKFLELECYLRTFLFRHEGPPFMQSFDSIKVGDVLDENPFTNYDTLGKLITDYNDVIRLKDPNLTIDPGIVDLRDALAHGRIYRRSPESQPRLLKFSKPKDGKVQTETAETLDPAALQRWNTFMFMTLYKVRTAL